jgi:hypothetical protein
MADGATRSIRPAHEGLVVVSRLFGTDGIRGVANVDLKPSLAHDLGRAVASRLVGTEGRMLVGQDTRRSGDMLVAALVSGGTSVGSDVHLLGVCPTPALAFVTADAGYSAGIMVSASHNPADDNGLKVLDGRGLKLDDAVEDELETLLIRSDELGSPTNSGLGRVVDARDAMSRYVTHRMALAPHAVRPAYPPRLCQVRPSGAPAILAGTEPNVSVARNPDGPASTGFARCGGLAGLVAARRAAASVSTAPTMRGRRQRAGSSVATSCLASSPWMRRREPWRADGRGQLSPTLAGEQERC